MAKKKIIEIFKEIFLNRKSAAANGSACNKVPYNTKQEAVTAARGIAKSNRQGMTAYKCKECPHWHVSSVKRKTLRPKTAKKQKYQFKYDRKKVDDS